MEPNTTPEAQARRLEAAAEQIASLLRQPDVAQRLRSNPGENEWSAMETVGHVIEMIPYWLDHCRKLIAATGDPPQFGRTLDAPERLAGVERGAKGDPDELIRLLREEARSAAQTIRNWSETDRAKKGIHNRRGEMTVGEVIEHFVVAHAEDHVNQIRAALT